MRRIVFILIAVILSSCGPKPEKSERLAEEGDMLMYYSRYEQAIEKYDKAIEYDPDNFEAYYQRGNAKASLRLYDAAIEDYTRAIEIHPKYADAYANRAQVKFYQGDKSGACDDWKTAQQLGKPNIGDNLRGCN